MRDGVTSVRGGCKIFHPDLSSTHEEKTLVKRNRVIIVHCWEAIPDNRPWYQYVRAELGAAGYEVMAPQFPDREHPTRASWVQFLADLIGEPDEGVVLIGHSVGWPTICRYLESLPYGKRVGCAISVAGLAKKLPGYPVFDNFFDGDPMHHESIAKRSRSFVAFRSDNDPYIPASHATRLNKTLGAEEIVVPEAGHFTGEYGDPNAWETFPQLVQTVQRAYQRQTVAA